MGLVFVAIVIITIIVIVWWLWTAAWAINGWSVNVDEIF